MTKKTTTRKNPLEQWQTEDAARLKALFVAKKEEMKIANVPFTQDTFAESSGISSGNMVWQYLSGHRPLNIAAAALFAQGLATSIGEFSPTLAERAVAHAKATNGAAPESPSDPLGLTCETAEEIGLLTAYRLAKKLNDLAILNSYDGITEELLSRLAAERKKVQNGPP
jgi:transcriptional regulator with XRE-family HTH domain